MSFSSYNPNERYRRRAAGRFSRLVMAFGVVFLIALFGFWVGKERAGHAERALRKDLKAANAANAVLQGDLTEARSEAQTAVLRLEKLQEDVAVKIPDERVEGLLELVRKQIEEGRDPERLAFLIRSARPPRNCSEIEAKRFVVSTPANNAPKSKIVIANGALVITGEGASARSSDGKPEAWFDASRKVALEFIAPGGKAEVKKGVFPIHHSVVVEDREYRFTVSEGARSFAKVTFDSCDYP
ncbi:MAG: hypothetical protein ACRBCT_09030 [Alphaproteobacteria bacterium]